MFELFSVDSWYDKLMVGHFLSVLEFWYFGLPADEACEIFVVDQEVEDGLGFG